MPCLQVGFSGTILYVPPMLEGRILANQHLLRLVDQGLLVLLKWDTIYSFDRHHNFYKENTTLHVSLSKWFCEDPDQALVYNHAQLVFNKFQRTALFFSDVDEFFIPQV